MNPEKRHLIQLTTDDMEKTITLYNQLMGPSAEARRTFIMNHKLSGETDIFEDDTAE